VLVDAVAASNRLTAAWAARQPDGSTAFSGLGAWVLLAALEAGAAGAALDELTAAAGVPAEDALAAVAEIHRLVWGSHGIHAALGVWVQAAVPLEPAWRDALPAGVVGSLSGEAAADQAALDAWVDRETGGELHVLPIAVDAATLLVLASALAVRTTWVEPFTPLPITFETGPWTGQQGERLALTVRDLSRVRVAETDAGPMTFVRVPGTGDVDVFVVIGAESAPAGAVLAAAIAGVSATGGATGIDLGDGATAPGLTVATVESPIAADQLDLRLTAFAVDAGHDLMAHGDLFGLAAAATVVPGHFPGISAAPLAVDEARQDVTARFTHEGFVAAAVTAVGMRAGAAFPTERHQVKRVTVTADRPFGFVAVHRPSGLVLVAGWIAEPTVPPPI
jgi:serine protease inhibitor